MVDFKVLDEKYIIRYVFEPDYQDFGGEDFFLLKKRREKYDENHISVSEAYSIAKKRGDSFSAGELHDIQCYIDAKALNDELGVPSDLTTQYIVARATERTEPFTKENTRVHRYENLKILNVMFGFEKYNPEDNLFDEKNEDSEMLHMHNPWNFIAEYEFQNTNCSNLRLEICNKKDAPQLSTIMIGDEAVADCVVVDEGNGHYLIEDLCFRLPKITSSKPYLEFYKIASVGFMVKEILDFISSGKRCLRKAGLVRRIGITPLRDRNSEPLTKQNISFVELTSINSIESLIKSIQLEEAVKWFTKKNLTLQTDEYYPGLLNTGVKQKPEAVHVNRLVRTKVEELEDCTSCELEFEKIPNVWTRKETELIMPKYTIQNSFNFPAYCSSTIAKGAFSNLENLKDIYIPETVNKIEDSAFENCMNLKSVVVEDGVEYGEGAFINCGGTKDFYTKTCLNHKFYSEQVAGNTGLASSIYVDVSGETEKRFGKLLLLAAADSDWERVGIPFTVEENPKIAVGSDFDLEHWKEYFDSNLEEKDLENIKKFIRKNLELLKFVSKLPQKKGCPDFEASNKILRKLAPVDDTFKKENPNGVLSQAEIDALLDV